MKIKTFTILFCFGLLAQFIVGQNIDCAQRFSWYDTISPYGNYIKYNLNGTYATLDYGNSDFRKTLPEQYSCDIADARIPKFKWDNHDFICLRYGCGSPCWGSLILPMNSTDSIRNVMYIMASDPENNIIVYIGGKNYENLVIENLKINTIQIIELSKNCGSAFLGYCIDSVSVNKNELYYRFAEPNRIVKNKELTEFRVKIK